MEKWWTVGMTENKTFLKLDALYKDQKKDFSFWDRLFVWATDPSHKERIEVARLFMEKYDSKD